MWFSVPLSVYGDYPLTGRSKTALKQRFMYTIMQTYYSLSSPRPVGISRL